MSSVSDLITRSLKEKYKSNIIEENVILNIDNIEKNDLISEDIINNLSSAVITGMVVNDIIVQSKQKRKVKN